MGRQNDALQDVHLANAVVEGERLEDLAKWGVVRALTAFARFRAARSTFAAARAAILARPAGPSRTSRSIVPIVLRSDVHWLCGTGGSASAFVARMSVLGFIVASDGIISAFASSSRGA